MLTDNGGVHKSDFLKLSFESCGEAGCLVPITDDTGDPSIWAGSAALNGSAVDRSFQIPAVAQNDYIQRLQTVPSDELCPEAEKSIEKYRRAYVMHFCPAARNTIYFAPTAHS